jgi:DNA-binding transcriptional MocR family regulator
VDDVRTWVSSYAPRISRISPSEIRERMKLVGDRAMIQLGVGLPDPSVVPYELLREASAAIFGDREQAAASMQYGPSEGYGPLREWLVEYMRSLGVECSTHNIMIVSGSQQAFDFLGKLFIAAGDTVMVQTPSFIGALRAFDSYEPRYLMLPDDSGAWESLDKARAKFCYTSPDFRNPTGTCMSVGDRHKLLALARRSGMLVIEDACYEKLRYDGATIPSVLALDIGASGDIERGRVCYTNTFSKTISPSLRVGWVVAPSELIQKLTLIKQASDLASSTFNQMLALHVASTYLLSPMQAMKRTYTERRDAMLDALRKHMPDSVTWTEPAGGLYVWLQLPPSMDGAEFALRALRDHSVSIISGQSFFPVAPDRATARLSFSLATPDEIGVGVARLAQLVRQMISPA